MEQQDPIRLGESIHQVLDDLATERERRARRELREPETPARAA